MCAYNIFEKNVMYLEFYEQEYLLRTNIEKSNIYRLKFKI